MGRVSTGGIEYNLLQKSGAIQGPPASVFADRHSATVI